MAKWIFFEEGNEDNPEFEVEAEDHIKAFNKAYYLYGPRVCELYYKEV